MCECVYFFCLWPWTVFCWLMSLPCNAWPQHSEVAGSRMVVSTSPCSIPWASLILLAIPKSLYSTLPCLLWQWEHHCHSSWVPIHPLKTTSMSSMSCRFSSAWVPMVDTALSSCQVQPRPLDTTTTLGTDSSCSKLLYFC